MEVWSTLFMKDSFATISVFVMAWPAGKEFVLGIHVIDPLLTNPLRSIWLNVGPGCFFSSSSLFVLFCFLLCFFFFFFAFLWNEKRFEVHKNAVKELVQHPAISMSVENQKIIEER